MSCYERIRGQSDLAKAASNALHTLHAPQYAASTIAGIRKDQKSEVGHVTPPPIPMMYCCIVMVMASSRRRAQNLKCLASAVPRRGG